MFCRLFQPQSKPVVFDTEYLKAHVHVVSHPFCLTKDIFGWELGRNETKIFISLFL